MILFLMSQLLMYLLSYSSLPWPFSKIIEGQFIESAESAVSIALIYGSQRTCSRSKVILVCGLVGSIGGEKNPAKCLKQIYY